MVLGAADRMLTVGDIQYEPPLPKIRLLTPSIAILPAGDFALYPEIYQGVRRVVYRRIAADPEDWWDIGEVANLYSSNYGAIRSRQAEAAILTPLGLSKSTLLAASMRCIPILSRT
jgi:hypothetical protein